MKISNKSAMFSQNSYSSCGLTHNPLEIWMVLYPQLFQRNLDHCLWYTSFYVWRGLSRTHTHTHTPTPIHPPIHPSLPPPPPPAAAATTATTTTTLNGLEGQKYGIAKHAQCLSPNPANLGLREGLDDRGPYFLPLQCPTVGVGVSEWMYAVMFVCLTCQALLNHGCNLWRIFQGSQFAIFRGGTFTPFLMFQGVFSPPLHQLRGYHSVFRAASPWQAMREDSKS